MYIFVKCLFTPIYKGTRTKKLPTQFFLRETDERALVSDFAIFLKNVLKSPRGKSKFLLSIVWELAWLLA